MTARDIILSMARQFYEYKGIDDTKLSELSKDARTYQRVKQLLDGYNTLKSQKSQIGSK